MSDYGVRGLISAASHGGRINIPGKRPVFFLAR